MSFLKSLAAQYPSNTEIITSGTSLQGEDITGIHIFGSAGKGKKPAVVLHGTVHAREWIGTMASLAQGALWSNANVFFHRLLSTWRTSY